ncbi:MAG: cereblon family protein [Desulfobulbaceae bacterium]|nr:cereblon family protein [Desulfobulbaceae bacterium]
MGHGIFCREINQPGASDTPETDVTDNTAADSEKSLLCRQCRAVIASRRDAVVINGNHLHAFFNPAGIIFEIRCFKQAAGCTVHGHPTDEFSWFQGYVWRYALCATCLIHLGWIFDSSEKFFFGLISDKLVEG